MQQTQLAQKCWRYKGKIATYDTMCYIILFLIPRMKAASTSKSERMSDIGDHKKQQQCQVRKLIVWNQCS